MQGVFKRNAKWSITQNYMAGPEQPKDNDDWRHLRDTTISYNVSPVLFTKPAGPLVKGQSTLTFGILYAFSSKAE